MGIMTSLLCGRGDMLVSPSFVSSQTFILQEEASLLSKYHQFQTGNDGIYIGFLIEILNF